MSRSHRSWIALAAIVAVAVPAAAQDHSARVDEIFAAWNRTDSPGCAVAVYRAGEIVFAKGYGMADLEHRVPITPRSVFYIGSTSKQFVAACIALLAEEGALGLDDDVRAHLSEFPDYGEPLTIRHLIHHTSGIRDYLTLWRLAGRDFMDYMPDDAVLEMICRQRELNFAPGERYLYSNSCYFLLGVIVERVSGRSLREYAQQEIFARLGMTRSRFHDDHRQLIEDRVFGYDRRGDGGGYDNLIMRFDLVGSGGLYSTVEDLARWDANFYDNRLGEGGPALLETLHTRGRLDDGTEIPYAFALGHGDYRGLATVSHGGALGGYRAQLLRFPAQRFSVAVLSNLAQFDPTARAHEVADVYLEDAFVEPKAVEASASASTADAAAERPARIRVDPAVFARYVGTYRVNEDRVLTITREADALVLRVTGWRQVRLWPTSQTEYFVEEAPVRVAFATAGGDSPCQELTAVNAGRAATARRVADVPTSAAQLAGFAGDYASPELGVSYRVRAADGRLRVRVGHPAPFDIEPTAPDRFVGEHGTFRFQRGADGAVTGFRLDAGRVLDLRFVRD